MFSGESVHQYSVDRKNVDISEMPRKAFQQARPGGKNRDFELQSIDSQCPGLAVWFYLNGELVCELIVPKCDIFKRGVALRRTVH